MGLLDDAIREHLELKRKHGANPEDLARQEREALGPGQRNEFAQPEGAAPAETDVEVEPVPEVEAPPEFAAEPAPADELPDGEPGIEEEPPAPEAPGYEEDPWLEEGPDEVPADEKLERQRGEDEDVLEETPDFLQETPEHDRLWFEQKPPKDFDWDK
jgi:hypothetical protein